MPELPLFNRTRFNATRTLLRSTTRSIRWSVPEFPASLAASLLRRSVGTRGFTPALQRKLRLLGLLAPGTSEANARSLSLPFGPSPSPVYYGLC